MTKVARNFWLINYQDVIPPTGWTWPLPFTIQQSGRGFRIKPGWSINQNRPTGKAYYVATNGNDGNSGLDAQHPLLTWGTALGKSDIVELHVASGVYASDTSWWGTVVQRDLSIIAEGGRAVIGGHKKYNTLTWTLDTAAGRSHTYKTAYTFASLVFDAKYPDANGDYQTLTKQASADLVEANPGSWYTDSTSVWIRLADSRAPDAQMRLISSAQKNVYRGSGSGGVLYCEGLDFEGGMTIYAPSNGPFPAGYFNNCTFKYSPGSGVNVNGATAYFWQCSGSRNYNDVFSYAGVTGGVAHGVEINCIGRDTGLANDDTNNGSTAHNGSMVVRINGEYCRTTGRPVHDVDPGTLTWLIGCYVHHSLASDPYKNVSIYSGGANGDGTKMWLDCCKSDGSGYDLGALTGSTIYTRSLISGGVNIGAGTITPY